MIGQNIQKAGKKLSKERISEVESRTGKTRSEQSMNQSNFQQLDFFSRPQKILTKAEYLETARNVAVKIAQQTGSVASDDIEEVFPRPDNIHKNVCGSIFKDERFVWCGVKKSRTPSRKGGMISTYKVR